MVDGGNQQGGTVGRLLKGLAVAQTVGCGRTDGLDHRGEGGVGVAKMAVRGVLRDTGGLALERGKGLIKRQLRIWRRCGGGRHGLWSVGGAGPEPCCHPTVSGGSIPIRSGGASDLP